MGGSLFNMADLYRKPSCEYYFGGFWSEPIIPSDRKVLTDDLSMVASGAYVQPALSSILKNTVGPDAKLYVDAQSKDSYKYLFKYGDSGYSEQVLYHFHSNTDENKKCLVYSADGTGKLYTKAVNCEEKYMPLCIKINKDKLDLFCPTSKKILDSIHFKIYL